MNYKPLLLILVLLLSINIVNAVVPSIGGNDFTTETPILVDTFTRTNATDPGDAWYNSYYDANDYSYATGNHVVSHAQDTDSSPRIVTAYNTDRSTYWDTDPQSIDWSESILRFQVRYTLSGHTGWTIAPLSSFTGTQATASDHTKYANAGLSWFNRGAWSTNFGIEFCGQNIGTVNYNTYTTVELMLYPNGTAEVYKDGSFVKSSPSLTGISCYRDWDADMQSRFNASYLTGNWNYAGNLVIDDWNITYLTAPSGIEFTDVYNDTMGTFGATIGVIPDNCSLYTNNTATGWGINQTKDTGISYGTPFYFDNIGDGDGNELWNILCEDADGAVWATDDIPGNSADGNYSTNLEVIFDIHDYDVTSSNVYGDSTAWNSFMYDPDLVSYWSFDTAEYYIKDTIDYNNLSLNYDGSVVDATNYYVPGKVGSAINLTGTKYYDTSIPGTVGIASDIISWTETTPPLNYTIPFSFGGWFKTNPGFVKQPSNSVSFMGYNFKIVIDFDDDDEIRFGTRSGSTINSIGYTTDWNDNDWHHTIGVYNTTHVILYYDGINVGNQIVTNEFDNAATYFKIGNSVLGSNIQNFNGEIDEVVMFTKALTADEVTLLYAVPDTSDDGLVAHYTMDDNTATTVVIDSIGNNNGTATDNTNTLSVDGKIGTALEFNGVDEYVNVNFDISEKSESIFSYCIWVNPLTTDDNYRNVFRSNWPDKGSFVMYHRNGIVTASLKDESNIEDKVTSTIVDNIWTQYCFIYNGTYSLLYKNSILEDVEEIQNNFIHDSISMEIGSSSFNGSIDEVMIYSNALSETEIQEIYNIQSIGKRESTGVSEFNYRVPVNITTNLLTLTLDTNAAANCSARIDVNQTYDEMVAANENYQFSTIEASEQSYTVFDDIPIGSSALYIACQTEDEELYSGALNIIRLEQFISTWTTDSTITLPLQSNGDYNFKVDWGDDTQDTITTYNQAEVTHTYDTSGTYNVSIAGTIDGWSFNNGGDKTKITDISNWGDLKLGNNGGYFYGCSNLLNITATDSPDLSETTNMYRTFAYTYFDGDLSNWDMSGVTTLETMFFRAWDFNQPLNDWDTSSVTNMNAMFDTASKFNQPLDNWNTSKVTNMGNVFFDNTGFNQDISSWDMSSVTDTHNMFYRAYGFDQDLGDWNVSKVGSMTNMFYGITLSTENYDSILSSWYGLPTLQSSVTLNGGNSKYCTSIYDRNNLIWIYDWSISDGGVDPSCTERPFISTWDTTETGTSSSTSITLPLIDTGDYDFTVFWGDGNTDHITAYDQAEVTHNYGVEGSYSVYINGTINGWRFGDGGDRRKISDISQWGDLLLGNATYNFAGCENLEISATDALNLSGTTTLNNMFRNAINVNADFSNWNTSEVTDMSRLFTNATSFNGDITTWDTSKVTNMESMFYNADAFNQSIGNWNTSSLTMSRWMFENAEIFNKDLTNWSMSGVTDMRGMFYYAPRFNGNIKYWDTSSAEHMEYMFWGATDFNDLISYWNTSSAINMYGMFIGSNFNQTLNYWDVSSVTDMSFMFSSATKFNHDLDRWDTSSVENMYGMFSYADDFNGDVSSWDVSSVTDMGAMFNSADVFNQNLGDWNVSQVTFMTNMLSETDLSIQNYDLLIFGWDELPVLQTGVELGANTLEYCASSGARQNIIDTYTWTFASDSYSGTCGLTDQINYTGNRIVYTFSGKYVEDGECTLQGTFDSLAQLDLCYQENADESSDCGGLSTGSYSTVDNIIYANYTKPIFATNSSFLTVKANGIQNVTIPDSCWYEYDDLLSFKYISTDTGASADYVLCKNETDWEPLLSYARGSDGGCGGTQCEDVGLNSFVDGDWDTFVRKSDDCNTFTETSLPCEDGLQLYEDAMYWNITIVTLNKNETLSVNAYEPFNFTAIELEPDTSYIWNINCTSDYLGETYGDNITLTTNNVEFLSTWDTTATSSGSSNSTQVSLPLESDGDYSFYVNWGDGSYSEITSYNQDEVTHDYSASGEYNISIYGTIEGFRFANTGDRNKIGNVYSWGDLNVGNNSQYFYGCENLDSTATDALDLTGTTDLSYMFAKASSFDSDLTNWNTSEVTDMSWMFWYTTSLNTSLSDLDMSSVTDMTGILNHATIFNNNISGWNTSSVTDMSFMLQAAYDFNSDISDWDTSNVELMTGAFDRAFDFNQNLSSWNTSSVIDMNIMFYSATSFNGNISDWDVSKVTNMKQMFGTAEKFNQNLTNWDTSSVTDMSSMFSYATDFNGNISNWNVSKVSNLASIFTQTNFNQPLSEWDVSKVTSMRYMFYGTPFNQNLSEWNVSSLSNADNMFTGVTLSTDNYDSLLIGWSDLILQDNVPFNAGSSEYCTAKLERDILKYNYTWSITDAGLGAGCDVYPPIISNQINSSSNNLPIYTFSAVTDEDASCTLLGNWTSTWEKNETIDVDIDTQFEFTSIPLPYDEYFVWGINCTDSDGNEVFGKNITFSSAIITTNTLKENGIADNLTYELGSYANISFTSNKVESCIYLEYPGYEVPVCGNNVEINFSTYPLFINRFYRNNTDIGCYQETATTAYDCGAYSNGSYEFTGTWNDEDALNDGDWSTGTNVSYNESGATMYVNYAQPSTVPSQYLWSIKDVNGTRDIVLPSACTTIDPLELKVDVTNYFTEEDLFVDYFNDTIYDESITSTGGDQDDTCCSSAPCNYESSTEVILKREASGWDPTCPTTELFCGFNQTSVDLESYGDKSVSLTLKGVMNGGMPSYGKDRWFQIRNSTDVIYDATSWAYGSNVADYTFTFDKETEIMSISYTGYPYFGSPAPINLSDYRKYGDGLFIGIYCRMSNMYWGYEMVTVIGEAVLEENVVSSEINWSCNDDSDDWTVVNSSGLMYRDVENSVYEEGIEFNYSYTAQVLSTTDILYDNEDMHLYPIDNRSDLESFEFNITPQETVTDFRIFYNNLLLTDMPGNLTTDNVLSIYAFDDGDESKDITFLNALSEIVYLNLSTEGNMFGLLFNVTGTDSDVDNIFSYTEDFSDDTLLNTTEFSASTNIGFYDTFFNAKPDRWQNVTECRDMYGTHWQSSSCGGITETIEGNLTIQTSAYCVYDPTPYREISEYSSDLNAEDLSYIEFPATFYTFATTGRLVNGGCDCSTRGNAIYLTDGSIRTEIYNAQGGGFINFTMYKVSSNTWDVYRDGVYSRSISTSGLDQDEVWSLQFKVWSQGRTCTEGLNYCGSDSRTSIDYIKTSGFYPEIDDGDAGHQMNGTLLSLMLNKTETSLIGATLTANDDIVDDGVELSYFMSNDNQSTWEEVTNRELHIFSTVGDTISYMINYTLPTDTSYFRVSEVTTDIIPRTVEDLVVDIANDGTEDYTYSGQLNSTTTPFRINLTSPDFNTYIDENCEGELTCKVPIKLSTSTPGLLTLDTVESVGTVHTIDIDEELFEHVNGSIIVDFEFTGGPIEVEELRLQYLGDARIDILSNYGDEDVTEGYLDIVYSNYNINIYPPNIEQINFYPWSPTAQNIQPFGQSSSTPIMNVTGDNYAAPANLSMILGNENSCVDITASSTNNKDDGVLLSGDFKDIYDLFEYEEEFSLWLWADFDCSYSDYQYYDPDWSFRGCCEDCICDGGIN